MAGKDDPTGLFFYGIQHCDLDRVKSAIKLGAKINTQYERGLPYASKIGCLDIVKYLAEERGEDIHINKDEAIKEAIANRHYDVIRYLFIKGARPPKP